MQPTENENEQAEFLTKYATLLQLHQAETNMMNWLLDSFLLEVQKKIVGGATMINESIATPPKSLAELTSKYSGPELQAVKKKPKRNFDKQAREQLNKWFFDHLHDPYPTDDDKRQLSQQTGLSIAQVNTWFGNQRMRFKRKTIAATANA